jgi:GH15 family glucan-1,4-alpha-glucosidase
VRAAEGALGIPPIVDLLRVASPRGPFAEEDDAETGRHLGNLPQAFPHLAMIEAAGRIIVVERIQEML